MTTPLGEFAGAFDVAVQPDGKVVAVGQAPGTENHGFRGTASDPDGEGLRRVQVALVRIVPHRAGASGSPKPRHWRTAHGKGTWSFKLPKPLTPGRYVVFSRAQDEQGLSEDAFSRRDHNRYRFRVTAPGD